MYNIHRKKNDLVPVIAVLIIIGLIIVLFILTNSQKKTGGIIPIGDKSEIILGVSSGR